MAQISYRKADAAPHISFVYCCLASFSLHEKITNAISYSTFRDLNFNCYCVTRIKVVKSK